MIYIHIEKGFIETEVAFDKNLTGLTFDDLYAGKYILLNAKQLVFLEAHPDVTPVEAFLMVTSPSNEEIFQQRKRDKIHRIFRYDQSDAVNSFFVNGVKMWLNRTERASLYTTIAAFKANDIKEITLWTSGMNPSPLTLNIDFFESLLMSLEIYAKECYDKTSEHKANVSRIETIEELIAYDHTFGYPEKLSVQI